MCDIVDYGYMWVCVFECGWFKLIRIMSIKYRVLKIDYEKNVSYFNIFFILVICWDGILNITG